VEGFPEELDLLILMYSQTCKHILILFLQIKGDAVTGCEGIVDYAGHIVIERCA
jgi:hypothetical protein